LLLLKDAETPGSAEHQLGTGAEGAKDFESLG
jgi:hypothetical protein